MKNILIILLFTLLSLSVSAQNLETLVIEGKLLKIVSFPYGFSKPYDTGRLELIFSTSQGEKKINFLATCMLNKYRASSDVSKIIIIPGSIENDKISFSHNTYWELEAGQTYRVRFQQICFSKIAGNAYTYEQYAIYNPNDCQGFTIKESYLWGDDETDPILNPVNTPYPNYSFFDKDGKIYLLVGFSELGRR